MRHARFASIKILGCLTLIALMSVAAAAQFRAGIQGVVTDNSGGVVPGATVVLKNTETNQELSTTSNNSGFYRFSNLPPAVYSISVEKENYKRTVIGDLRVAADSSTGKDIVLEPGGVNETVTVEADALILQTEDANTVKTVSTAEVLGLPQTGRDPYELARLAPGVFGAGARSSSGDSVRFPNTSGPGGSNSSIFQTENAVPISANGQRVSSNNYQIDGTSVNSLTWGGAAIVTPSQESVKEMQVTSSTYSAEDGRNSGAQIKVITQNGTNELHGSAFFKYNDPELNAFNVFPARIGSRILDGPRRVERRFKSFGGSFGGSMPFFNFGEGVPMFTSAKDKFFYFFTYEGARERTNNPYLSFIETSAFRQNVIASRPGSVTSAVLSQAGVEPRVVNLVEPGFNSTASRYTCGTAQMNVPAQLVNGGIDFGSLIGTTGTYVANDQNGGGFDSVADLQCALLSNPRDYRADQLFMRFDYLPTDKDKITFSGIFTPTKSVNASADSQSRPQSDFTSERMNFAISGFYIRNFSSTVVNEFRVSHSGWAFDELKSNPDADFGIPRVEIEAIWGGRLRFGIPQPGKFKDRQYDIRDTVTWVVGNHVLKIGGSFRLDKNAGGNISQARPLYSFVRLWNFANDAPVYESIATDANGNPRPNDTIYYSTNTALFLQDDFKFRPNFTINAGLRWEYFSPITVSNGVIGNIVLDQNGGLAGARIETNKTLTDSDWNNFGPQLGFAWAPTSFKNKMVIRGGGGIGYDRLANALLDNARRNPPAPALFGVCCGNASNPYAGGQIVYGVSSNGIFGYPVHPLLGRGLNPANGLPNSGAAEIYGSERNLPTSYVYRYSLEGQYELPWRTIATLGYQGSAGRKFVRIDRVHITGPSTNPNISAAYLARPDVNTNFNALLASIRTRFSKGLDLSVNYRFSKSLDNTSFEAACACTNQTFPIDQKEEHGPSDFDVRHSITASAVWDIPLFTDKTRWQNKILGGWQISPIVTYHTGFPWTPTLFGCLQGTTNNSFCDPRPPGYNGQRPLANTNANFLSPTGLFPGGGTAFFDTTFDGTNPFANRPGIGRNTFFGPKYFSTDISLNKRFGLPGLGFMGENAGLDIRVNFFNVFNTLNIAPISSLTDPARVTSAGFGGAASGLSGRVGEFQARFSF